MSRQMQDEQRRRGWRASPERDLLGHQMSQGRGRWPEPERLHSSIDKTGTAGDQVPTQPPHEGSTLDQSKRLKKLQQRPCKLLLFVSAETRTEHFFRMLCKLCEFKGLTLTQLETQRMGLSCEEIQCQDNQAARRSFQRMTGKESAHPKGGGEPPASSRTPGSCSGLRGNQGTGDQDPAQQFGKLPNWGERGKKNTQHLTKVAKLMF